MDSKNITDKNILTLNDLFPFVLKPGIQGSSLATFHGCTLIEMLREMTLIQPCAFYYLTLWNIMLLHVHFDHLCSLPWVHSSQKTKTVNEETNTIINWYFWSHPYHTDRTIMGSLLFGSSDPLSLSWNDGAIFSYSWQSLCKFSSCNSFIFSCA